MSSSTMWWILGAVIVAIALVALTLRKVTTGTLQGEPARVVADAATPAGGPDYSNVDQATAREMVEAGTLERLFLLPKAFGGRDIPQNVVFVPPFAVASKERFDLEIIGPMVKQGKLTEYVATPKYQGQSVVPNAIEVVATKPGEFRAVVEIWGHALAHD